MNTAYINVHNIASVTSDAILIDTRISDSEEFIEEPGGSSFDAIIETRVKKTPVLERLIQLMSELGFQTEQLTIDDATPTGLKEYDDYSQSKRTTLLAKRTLGRKAGNG